MKKLLQIHSSGFVKSIDKELFSETVVMYKASFMYFANIMMFPLIL